MSSIVLRSKNGARLHGCAHRFKFETARFAEWLERISGPFPNEFTHFVDRKIGREVLFGDEAQRGFSLRQDCVRGAKANAIQQSIGVQQRLRFSSVRSNESMIRAEHSLMNSP